MQSIFIKSFFRRRAIVLLSMLLIMASTFAAASNFFQSLMVERETERLKIYFRPIGYLKSSAAYNVDVSEGIKILDDDPRIIIKDIRRPGAGFLKEGKGITLPFFFYTYHFLTKKSPFPDFMHFSGNNVYVCGTLKAIDYDPGLAVSSYQGELHSSTEANTKKLLSYQNSEREKDKGVWLTLDIDELLAGDKRFIGDRVLHIAFLQDGTPECSEALESLAIGKRYSFRICFDPSYRSGKDFYGDWSKVSIDWNFFLRELIPGKTWYLPLEADEQVDPVSDPRFSPILGIMQILEENQKSVRVLVSKDMSTIPLMQETSWNPKPLTEGRWLNEEDTREERKVCVIPGRLAQENDLKLGDHLNLILRRLPYAGIQFIHDSDVERYKDFEAFDYSLEIVGISDSQVMAMDVYIPDSLMPQDFPPTPDGSITPAYYSFVLRSSEDKAAFTQDHAAELAKIGLEITFVENNGEGFDAAVKPLLLSTQLNARVTLIILIFIFILTAAYLLIIERKNVAIARSIGLHKSEIAKPLLFSFGSLAFISIIMALVIAAFQVTRNTKDMLSKLPLPNGVKAETFLPWSAILIFAAVALICLLLFYGSGLCIMLRMPVLTLLKERLGRTGTDKGTQATQSQDGELNTSSFFPELHQEALWEKIDQMQRTSNAPPQQESRFIQIFLRRFLSQYNRRNPARTFLTFVLSAALMAFLCRFSLTLTDNNKVLEGAYENSDIRFSWENASPLVVKGSPHIYEEMVDHALETGTIEHVSLMSLSERERFRLQRKDGTQQDVRRLLILQGITRLEDFYFEGGQLVRDFLPEGEDKPDYELSESWTVEDFDSPYESRRDFSYTAQSCPALLNPELMSELKVKPGDELIFESAQGKEQKLVIAGTVEGNKSYITVPLSFIFALDGVDKDGNKNEDLVFCEASFTVKRAYNRGIQNTIDEIQNYNASFISNKQYVNLKRQNSGKVGNSGLDIPDIGTTVYDEEIRITAQALEKNVKTLSLLYPFLLLGSALILVFFSSLNLHLLKKEMALLRIVAVPRKLLIKELLRDIGLSLFSALIVGFLFAFLTAGCRLELIRPAILIFFVMILPALLWSDGLIRHILNKSPLELLQESKK